MRYLRFLSIASIFSPLVAIAPLNNTDNSTSNTLTSFNTMIRDVYRVDGTPEEIKDVNAELSANGLLYWSMRGFHERAYDLRKRISQAYVDSNTCAVLVPVYDVTGANNHPIPIDQAWQTLHTLMSDMGTEVDQYNTLMVTHRFATESKEAHVALDSLQQIESYARDLVDEKNAWLNVTPKVDSAILWNQNIFVARYFKGQRKQSFEQIDSVIQIASDYVNRLKQNWNVLLADYRLSHPTSGR